jgi:hypothetical protein
VINHRRVGRAHPECARPRSIAVSRLDLRDAPASARSNDQRLGRAITDTNWSKPAKLTLSSPEGPLVRTHGSQLYLDMIRRSRRRSPDAAKHAIACQAFTEFHAGGDIERRGRWATHMKEDGP